MICTFIESQRQQKDYQAETRHSAAVECLIHNCVSSPVPTMVCNTVLHSRIQPWEAQLRAAPKACLQAQAAMLHNMGSSLASGLRQFGLVTL